MTVNLISLAPAISREREIERNIERPRLRMNNDSRGSENEGVCAREKKRNEHDEPELTTE